MWSYCCPKKINVAVKSKNEIRNKHRTEPIRHRQSRLSVIPNDHRIDEDAVLEAICRASVLESDQTGIYGEVKPEEKIKLIRRASRCSASMRNIFEDDQKMTSFIREAIGNTEYDREINDEIIEEGKRLSRQRFDSRMSTCSGRQSRCSNSEIREVCGISLRGGNTEDDLKRSFSLTSMKSLKSVISLNNVRSGIIGAINGDRKASKSILADLAEHRTKILNAKQKQNRNSLLINEKINEKKEGPKRINEGIIEESVEFT